MKFGAYVNTVVKPSLDTIEVMFGEGDIQYEHGIMLGEAVCNVQGCLEDGDDSRVLDDTYCAFIKDMDELKAKKGKVN